MNNNPDIHSADQDETGKAIAPETSLSATRRWKDTPLESAASVDLPSLHYVRAESLGHGAMGDVWRADDPVLPGRRVAVKLLRGGTADAAGLEQLRREAELTAQVEHPNVVRLIQFGRLEGQPCFVMEYVSGGSLSDLMKSGLPTPDDAAKLVAAVARGVQAAHDRGIIHRDLKPGNVLLAEDGTPKVSDFGLAGYRERLGHEVAGTPPYMAPEQTRPDGHANALSDVYGLGAILYALLTGRPPVRAANVAATLELARMGAWEKVRQVTPEVPAGLAEICERCLARDPAQRYSSAKALADEIDQFLDAPNRRRRRVQWAAAAVLLVVALTLAGVFGQRWRTASRGLDETGKQLGETEKKLGIDQQRLIEALDGVRQTAQTDIQLAANSEVILSHASSQALGDRLQKHRETYEQLHGRGLLPDADLVTLGRIRMILAWINALHIDHPSLELFDAAGAAFEKLAPDHPEAAILQAEVLSDRSVALRSLAADARADASLAEAAAILERWRVTRPDDDAPRFHLASVHFWWGVSLREREKDREAIDHLSRAIEIFRPVAAANPRFGLAVTRFGEMYLHRALARVKAEPAAAMADLDVAQERLGYSFLAAHTDPDTWTVLRTGKPPKPTFHWYVQLPDFAAQKDLVDLKALEQARELCKARLAAAPNRPEEMRRFARASFLSGIQLKYAGDWEGYLIRALKPYDDAYHVAPSADAALELAGAYVVLAWRYFNGKRFDDCAKQANKMIAWLETMKFNAKPLVLRRDHLLYQSLLLASAAEAGRTHIWEALKFMDQASKLFPDRDSIIERDRRVLTAGVSSLMTSVFVRNRQWTDAFAAAQMLSRRDDAAGETLYNCACVYAQAATVTASPIFREVAAAKSIALVRRAFRAGFGRDAIQAQFTSNKFKADPLKFMQADPDFALVRGRPEFQKLVAELSPKS